MSDDEGPDLLVEIFDLVGLYTKADDPRLALQSALRRLAAKCASFESKSLDELSDSELADIEVEATNVQQQIAAYRETIRRAKSESFQLSQEITQLPSFSEVLSWQLLAFSLLSVLQKHLVEEAHALDQLEQSLDCLYADDGFQTIELVCTCLDRRSIREAFVFREASKALQEQLANQVSLREIAGFDDAAALGQTPTSNVSFVPSHGDVCNQKQIMDAVRVFLGPGQTIDYSTFTSLLVVGPEGSGKSHVCDQVERVAQMTRVSHGKLTDTNVNYSIATMFPLLMYLDIFAQSFVHACPSTFSESPSGKQKTFWLASLGPSLGPIAVTSLSSWTISMLRW